ncbi:hypothetical protein UPYG_G00258200 [Umbra pygmaea]|uniref:Secreted protein n=1 Tax=Umbra pygmaea TaxID=75934 RepID=A0ABD0WST3_UMBPY
MRAQSHFSVSLALNMHVAVSLSKRSTLSLSLIHTTLSSSSHTWHRLQPTALVTLVSFSGFSQGCIRMHRTAPGAFKKKTMLQTQFRELKEQY